MRDSIRMKKRKDKTKAIETKTGYITVMNKMLAFLMGFIFWVPVAADRQDGVGATDVGHHVRQSDTAELAIFVLVGEGVVFEDELHMALV